MDEFWDLEFQTRTVLKDYFKSEADVWFILFSLKIFESIFVEIELLIQVYKFDFKPQKRTCKYIAQSVYNQEKRTDRISRQTSEQFHGN